MCSELALRPCLSPPIVSSSVNHYLRVLPVAFLQPASVTGKSDLFVTLMLVPSRMPDERAYGEHSGRHPGDVSRLAVHRYNQLFFDQLHP